MMDDAQFYQQMARKRLVRRPQGPGRPAPKAPMVYPGQPPAAVPTMAALPPRMPPVAPPPAPASSVDPSILKRRQAGSIKTSFPELGG